MMEYKRLTKWDVEKWGEGLACVNGKTSIDKDITLALNRLAELEDKIEQGTLVDTVEGGDWIDGYKQGFKEGVQAVQIQAKDKIDEICKELTEE